MSNSDSVSNQPVQKLTSNQNPRYKNALKLHTSRGRNQQNRIIIFGVREVTRALSCGIDLQEVYYSAGSLDSPEVNPLREQLTAVGTAEFELTDELFEKLKYGNRNDGVVAIANRPRKGLQQFPLSSAGLLLVIQAVENPGNLGAIARSADGANAAGIIVVDSVTDIYHPNSIRTSMGTVFSLPIAITTTSELQPWLKQEKITTFVARPDAKNSLFDCDLSGRCAVILGNEALGVSSEWATGEFSSISLPMLGLADSLNVSVSASILAYESLRQRTRSV